MVDEIIQDIWELYGLKYNPFSTLPILVQGGTVPPESFIGRKHQLEQLGKVIGSKGGSRSLVYGDVGVGKTSFVNILRKHAYSKGFFTHFKEIKVQTDWNLNDFVLNTLAAIYSTLKILEVKPVSDKTFSTLESVVELTFDDSQLGFSLAGFGGEYGKDRKSPIQITSTSLVDFFEKTCNEIRSKTGKEIVIHYNNLELLSEKGIKELFENLRDFFQTDCVHFIFVGNLNVKAYFQTIPRFSSILSDTPIHIETLKYEEVREIIKKRFEYLRINEDFKIVVPFTEDCLKVLFNLWGGNIRHVLNSLDTAIKELTREKTVILDENLLARTLKTVLEKRYYGGLTSRKRDVLDEIVKRDEITNKHLSKLTGIKRPNVSHYIKDLERLGIVYLKRKTGKDKFWASDPIFKWSQLKEKKNPQKTLFTWS